MIGASRERGTVGGQIFHNLLEAGFEGVVYPVNPAADVVQSVRAYPTVADVPDEVDLAVIAVPAAAVIEVARECADKGVPALVVISAGFAEVGPEGAERQDRAGRDLPRRRHATRRAQLPRDPEHGRARAAERDLRPRRPRRAETSASSPRAARSASR